MWIFTIQVKYHTYENPNMTAEGVDYGEQDDAICLVPQFTCYVAEI